MKTLKKQIQSMALILSILVLIQSCTVYRSVPISIETAVKNKSKVKIVTKNNNKLRFNRIEFQDGKYFGIKKFNSGMVKASLDENSIETIKEKDKTLSTILSIGIPGVIVDGLIVLGITGFSGFAYY